MKLRPLHSLPLALAATTLLAACASMGRPGGGPRDTEAPRFVSAWPAPGSTSAHSKRITITFDENVQLDNPSEKVVVSPTPVQPPAVSANGRRVTIELRDSVLDNTTYTIDLADAVKDLNEGNVLDGFAMDFSTGPDIDTLSISGMVMEGRTLEPAQGMLVGVYSTPADTAFATLRLERIAKTNRRGQFSVRNLPQGTYQIFALNDLNRDYHWDITEDLAFADSLITPASASTMVTDTLIDLLGEDSIVNRQATRFLPDDVLLTWFNHDYRTQYITEYTRPERHILQLLMGAPVDSLPRITVIAAGADSLHLPLERASVLERSQQADSLKYWLTDTSLIASDSLLLSVTYRRTDSLQQLQWTTDTLKFNMRRARGKKNATAPRPHRRTLAEKIDSVLAISDTLTIDTFALSQPDSWLSLQAAGGSQDLHRPLRLVTDQPLSRLHHDGVHLEWLNTTDTVWVPAAEAPYQITPSDSVALTSFRLDYPWRPDTKYRLTVDSMAVVGIYGVYNKPVSTEFTTKALEDYSNIYFRVTGLDSVPAVVELLSATDEPVSSAPVVDGTAEFHYVDPGTYYARLYLDADSNGVYTTGSLALHRQPESTYYFPKKINLKKNWDVDQQWDINELPIDRQKPEEIKKNKATKNARRNSSSSDDEEDDDQYYPGVRDYESPFGGSAYGNYQNPYLHRN